MAYKDLRENKDRKVNRGHRENKVRKASKDHRANRVHRENKVRKASRGHRALLLS